MTAPAHPRAASRGTVLASIFRSALVAAERDGLDRMVLLSRTGVDPALLDDPEARVPQPAYMRLWEEIEARTRDPFFGLHFAESQVDASTFSVVGFAARSSETMGEALARVSRFSRLLNDAEEITLARAEDVVIVGQNPRGALPPWPRHKAEGALANYVLLGRAWTGAAIRPLEVRFRHGAPRDLSEHRRIFGCPLRFEQARNEVRFDPGVLALSMRAASPDLGAYLTQKADRLLESVPTGSLLDDVRRAVRDTLPSGAPTLASVARRLGLSTRSLQRRLADDATTFAELVDDVRRELALEMIGDRRLTVEALGLLVGFADARGFRRAFERWTGRSPREARSAAMAG